MALHIDMTAQIPDAPQPSDSTAAADSVNPRYAEIMVIERSYGDSLVLRWGPTTAGAWSICNAVGYIVERAPVDSTGFDPDAFTRLTPTPLKPWTLDEWMRRATKDNKYAAVAAQMLYGAPPVLDSADGNDEISRMRAASEVFAARHGLALLAADNDPVAAEGLGLRFVDHNVHVGEKWVYRVSIAQPDSTYQIADGFLVVDVEAYQRYPAPSGFVPDEGDGQITLRWPYIESAGFIGYFLERSTDEGKTWVKLNNEPIVVVSHRGEDTPEPLQYLDTGLVNGRIYRYRIIGQNSFGELSEPAELDASPRDITPPFAPTLAEPEQIGATALRLRWKMEERSPDLAGFRIARSSNSTLGFHELLDKQLPLTVTQYIDSAATAEEPYYMVVAVDTAGNVARSLVVMASLIDSLPPSAPKGLTGTIDTNGIVHLTWRKNPERDMLGYRVLWANASEHEFTQRTPLVWTDTTFIDTIDIHTLTRDIYYRVAAVDDRMNHSEPSEILELKRPDVVAPQPSIFADVFVTDTSVVLRWTPSPSEDVAHQFLMRREASQEQWRELAKLKPTINTYTDTAVVQTVSYDYALIVEDSSGLRSIADGPVRGRPYDPGVRPGVEDLRAVYDSANGRVRLQWRYSPSRGKEEYWFVIYRAIDKAPMDQYQASAVGATEFVDASLPLKGAYSYAVQVMSATASSRLSETVEVRVGR